VRHAGHEAAVATDGFAALELARQHRPQLILLDLQLPKLDGWTVVKLLRKESWAKNVPIVAVSASASPGDEHKAIEAGCTAFLSKPYYPAASHGGAADRTSCLSKEQKRKEKRPGPAVIAPQPFRYRRLSFSKSSAGSVGAPKRPVNRLAGGVASTAFGLRAGP